MDEFFAQVSWDRIGVVGLCVFFTVAFMRKWIVPGWALIDRDRVHADEVIRQTASHDAVVAFQTVALATERLRGDRLEAQNLRLMGYVEEAMKPTTALHSPQEA